MTLRFTLLTAAIVMAAIFPHRISAQDAAPASMQEELRALRQLVEQQSKQIQTLTEQIARMNSKLDDRAAGAPVVAAPEAAPAPRVVAAPQPAPPPQNVHIVVKGDSLEKIAKLHGIMTADLQKLNKIADPKRIQIGQQIILPPNAAPVAPAAAQTEKKE